MDDITGIGNRRLLELAKHRRESIAMDQGILFPWRRPCRVSVLLVTDGILDFSVRDFGLRAFVDILLHEHRHYVDFSITTAHLKNNVTDSDLMQSVRGVTRIIKGIVFDDPSHFTKDMYDEVWLFGIETNFHRPQYSTRLNSPNQYPADSLGVDELLALSAHMQRGGGVFATGDHGQLGKGLCGAVNRVRSMRYWDDFPPGSGFNQNEVSMTGARRNDTNQIGHDPGSQFSDQSDDVPQPLDLKLYSSYVHVLKEARYPHPVMCSRLGRIDVFPDHPHEGECREPAVLTDPFIDGSSEYPAATDGSGTVAPEIVAYGRVVAGNNSIIDNAPTKIPTQAHSFGVVSVYDGHRAGVGRVVCDSTWHHFINVNLIGVVEGLTAPFDDFPDAFGGGTPNTDISKHEGFLHSAAGRAALDKIKEYFVNVGVWIAPPDRHTCFHIRNWWELIWTDRLVEATLLSPDLQVETIPLFELYHIGVHARGVLGEKISVCQTIHWLLPWIDELYPEIVWWIDPWGPRPPRRLDEPILPWLDVQPIIDIAIGSALVTLRQAFPYPPEDLDDSFAEDTLAVAMRGAAEGLRRGVDGMSRGLREVQELLSADIRTRSD